MPTSDLLQKPSIISITGSTIRVAHPDISSYLSTRLSAPIAVAGDAVTVLDNHAGPDASGGGWVDNDWLLFGAVGDSKTEINDINDATLARGTAVTVTTSILKFAHEVDCPVTKILERGIKIYGAATDGGDGTIIASIGAITASAPQLADCMMIQWDKSYTEYTMIAGDTAYAYYYVTFTDGTTDSDASDYVLAAGPADNSVYNMVTNGLDLIGEELGGKFSNKWALTTANNCQDNITHYVRKTRAGVDIVKNWSFELAEDNTSISLAENENKYALSALSFDLKQTDTKESMLSIRIGAKKPLTYIDIDEYDREMTGIANTTLSAAAAASDVLLYLTDASDFNSIGVVYIGDDTYNYAIKDVKNSTLAMNYTASTTVTTTLSAAGSINDTTLTVNSITSFADGDFIRVTDGTHTQVFAIDGDPATSTITLDGYLAYDYAATVTTVAVVTSSEITSTIASGTYIWQNINPTLPTKYTIFNGYFLLNAPVDTDYVGYKLKVRGIKMLDRFTDLSDTTEIKFYDLFHLFVAARGELRKGNTEEGNYWMNEFKSALKKEALRDATPIMEEFEYKSLN